MRFDNCKDCGKYKYLKGKGICPTCDSKDKVRIKLDIIDDTLRNKDFLLVIANTLDAVSGVKCDGATNFNGKKHDDLDLKQDHCRLFEAEKEYKYKQYNGSKSEKVRKAMLDALRDSKDIYSN